MNRIIKFLRSIAVIWGFSSFIFLLIFALIRLSDIAIDSFNYDYNFYHWAALICNGLFMAYSEGYKGFQKSFSPRLAARLKYLYEKGNPIELILAPLFCMSFFNAPKKRIFISIALTILIIGFIIFFHKLPQPWRGILDVGVLIGLTWGVIVSCYYFIQAFKSSDFLIDPEINYK
tara:strand:- start:481 stop:1005 length:525 start_codon:yes stop_codon:yes gene_type:complete